MGFIQALFLAGTATFALPVIIHLIFRTRKKHLVFSSLRFLKESMLRESRRLRLRDLILLLLRCAACILIALAFSRPYRHGQVLAGADGTPREDLVIVLDDSPSLDAQESTRPRWEDAQKTARGECQARKPGDRVALVLGSDPGRPEIELSANFGAVLSALQRKKPSSRRGDLAQALRTGLGLLADSTAPRRRVLVISDWQANQVDRGVWAEIADEVSSANRRVVVELSPPSEKVPGRLNNIAVSDIRARSDVWIEGRPVRFAVRIHNHGQGEVPDLAVRLVVNGKVEGQRTVGLGPFGGTEIELGARFDGPGPVSGHVEIDAHDAFPEDDQRHFAMQLRDSVKVVVIEDSLRETEVFFDQSYYLRMALDPGARGEGATVKPSTKSYIQVVSLPVSELTPTSYKNAEAIFMVGVSRMPDATLATLEEAVRGGRNLVMFLGRSDGEMPRTWYNDKMWKNGAGLLPARLAAPYQGDLLEGKYNGLDAFKADHPIFKVFAGENERDLRLPKYLRSQRIVAEELGVGAPKRPAGEVLASFNDGSPFLVERPLGKGMILTFAFCPRPERDTDLPKRKAFVPLIHQVVRYLLGVEENGRRNLLAGDEIRLLDAGVAPDANVAIKRPPPIKDELALMGADSVTADQIGVYEGTYRRGEIVEKALWAANLDPMESDLNVEEIDGLRTLFPSNQKGEQGLAEDGPTLKHQSPEELKAQAHDWRYFLVAALLCLLLEVLIRDIWGS